MVSSIFGLSLNSEPPKVDYIYPFYFLEGKTPIFQFTIPIGQTVDSITITNGTDAETPPSGIAYKDETNFRSCLYREQNYTPSISGDLYMIFEIGGVNYYTDFIRFSRADCLMKIECYHQTPIVQLDGRYMRFDLDFKNTLYLPKVFRQLIGESETNTDQRDLIRFDTSRSYRKDYSFEAIGSNALQSSLELVEMHSYILLDGVRISGFEVEPKPVLGEKTVLVVKYSEQGIISTNTDNGTILDNFFELSPISTSKNTDFVDCSKPILLESFKAIISNRGTQTPILIINDIPSSLAQNTNTFNGIESRHVISTLNPNTIYQFSLNGNLSSKFQLWDNIERVMSIKVEHDEIIQNGSEYIHLKGVSDLKGLFRMYKNIVRTEIETEIETEKRDLVEFNYYFVKKKWYYTQIEVDYTQISFINFVEICDNVLIEIDGKEYQCKDIEFEEPQYKSQTIATIDLRFSIGEIWRSRAASKALGVHGEYDNAEYSDDYNNIF